MVRLSGAALGCFAFSITILLGLLADNSVEVTLVRAIWAMGIFCLLGMATGWVANRVLDEHALRKHHEYFPDGELTDEAGQTSPDSEAVSPEP